MKPLKHRILDVLPFFSTMSVREVAHAVGIFTELWDVREELDRMAEEGLIHKEMRVLTTSEKKQKGLSGDEHFRWVYRQL